MNVQERQTGLVLVLSEQDGNAFAILGAARRVLRKAGVDNEDIEAFMEEATAGTYDELLQTCFAWFDVQ